jgi:hypothetical protein
MTPKQKQKLLDLLSDLSDNCGDSRGRDGEYLSDTVIKIMTLAEKIKVVE